MSASNHVGPSLACGLQNRAAPNTGADPRRSLNNSECMAGEILIPESCYTCPFSTFIASEQKFSQILFAWQDKQAVAKRHQPARIFTAGKQKFLRLANRGVAMLVKKCGNSKERPDALSHATPQNVLQRAGQTTLSDFLYLGRFSPMSPSSILFSNRNRASLQT
ncbi:hypothetical protein CCM_09285 [Cordyceps militaris CM01]|uniref:Uncharacterized protein n=1 Tax=Cordyceps militaris (strain CM01) TaxID=983644 RepID=G3JTZ5_CORMM|nr:uncharacterized protein CCM_09285 [Cordyceps militaris CM01]EGX88149.1 hypothetical protein CCM_09285 [Cordyceps militaris CM01]